MNKTMYTYAVQTPGMGEYYDEIDVHAHSRDEATMLAHEQAIENYGDEYRIWLLEAGSVGVFQVFGI